MIASSTLLKDLQKRVTLLEEDLRRRCDAEPQVNAPLQAQYAAARESKRTAETFNAWRDEQITQIAVAWVLACVFVRFLEDNQLLDTPFLAGPDAARMNRARDEQELFFKQHPTASERDYLLHVFDAVGQLPGMREFFDRRHNPLWLAGPTGDALAGLLDFWRKTNPDSGALAHDFTDPDWNTRFLGDLYQDLSEFARKRYALLQTPEFVEQFILDRTLTPAIDAFGYRVVRMLDLTCGSGHFLLGGFDRLFKLWQEHEPGENPRVLAQRALDQVCGVDLNSNVIAIARFRLLLAALQACQPTPDAPPMRLKDAPDFKIHLAVGDSLLHGARFHLEEKQAQQQTFGGVELFRDELHHFYDTEDREALHRILGRQYHVVVGNPPYITVKDKALNQLYRDRFDSCHRKYSLAAPFMERFFDFAIRGEPALKWDPFAAQRAADGNSLNLQPSTLNPSPQPAGYVGMITANSFMKREFGRKLIEECIPRWDLTHVIDTSGAYIPGHGTPTVILFGKHQPPVAATLRTVMGIKGEPATPADPARGLVWTAILRQVDQPGSESDFVSVADSARENFHKHPWSIGGGGAAELKEQLDEAAEKTLQKSIGLIGVFGMTNADEVMLAPASAFLRQDVEPDCFRRLVMGDEARDWHLTDGDGVVFPYAGEQIIPVLSKPGLHRWLWACRTVMGNRATFGKLTYFQEGRPWWEWHQVALERLVPASTIAFGEVTTHNHFVLDRGGKVFNRTAPVIKLPEDATEDAHLSLLGLLNSSTACFWLKQACFPKGGDHQGNEGARVRTTLWDERYAFNSTQVGGLPIPAEKPLALARELDRLAQELKAHAPAAIQSSRSRREEAQASSSSPVDARAASPRLLQEELATARQQWTALLQRMIALQEELDWWCYGAYGLVSEASGVIFDVSGLNPDASGPKPDVSGPFPDTSGSKPDVSGLFPDASGLKPDVSGSFPDASGLKPDVSGLLPDASGLKPDVSGLLPDASGLKPDSSRLKLDSSGWNLDSSARKPASSGGHLSASHWPSAASGTVTGGVGLAIPPLRLGERAFEIVLARKLAKGEAQTAWFERHGSTPITELPAHWPAGYRAVVERRLALIARDRNLALIEQPEYKRRWNTEPWDDQQERALRQWLLNRLEGYFFEGDRVGRLEDGFSPAAHGFRAATQPALVSTNQLAELVQADAAFLKVAEVYVGAAGFSVPKLVRELVEAESVPFLPFQRYKESGLRKRQDWERTWDLQREEDRLAAQAEGAGGNPKSEVRSPKSEIPVPPKYASADFKSSTFWRLRGKLDVPKERWLSYPGAAREGDPSPVIAWAGWNHLQQAQALAEYYITAKDTWGWSPERLQLLLAGLADLLPWLQQWHNELNPEYGMGLGDYFAGFLDEECRKNGTTVEGVEHRRFGEE